MIFKYIIHLIILMHNLTTFSCIRYIYSEEYE